jgi:hypothetical protein
MSKKQAITIIVLNALIALSMKAPPEHTFKYGCLLAGTGLAYLLGQGILDYFKE